MKLAKLRAFKEVFEAKTVTGAARRLRCSQPRVSRLLQELEEEIGFLLFQREKQRLEPTIEGKRFYVEIERILVGIDDIDSIAEDILKKRQSTLRILAQSHIAHGLLPEVFAEFSKKYEDLRHYVEIRSRVELEQWLEGHQFDLALTHLPARHPLTRHQYLLSTKLLVAIPENHPLSDQEYVSLEDLATEPIIALKRGTLMRQRLDDLTYKLPTPLHIRVETPTMSTACHMVSKGLGITLAEPFVANCFRDNRNLVIRPFKPDYKIDYGMLYLKQNLPNSVAMDFIETTRNVALTIAQKW